MKYLSVSEYADAHDVSERTVRIYCSQGKLEGAFLTGKTWNIPENAIVDRAKHSKRIMPLLSVLREEKKWLCGTPCDV